MARINRIILYGAVLAVSTWAQETTTAKHDLGSGAANIGVGAAKGAGDIAKGTGKGALALVTLHPVNAATSVGKGAVAGGKDVSTGTVKGSTKIGRGVGKGFKKIF